MFVSDQQRVNKGHADTFMPIKPHYAWKTRTYPVPTLTRSRFRWKASALRGLPKWMGGLSPANPATVIVPALYNFLPAESIAMGWLNEIDALTTIRQRIIYSAKLTGWDVFTFHTLYNLDHYFDSTIAAVRETWVKEGNLSVDAMVQTKQRFGKPYDYHRVQPRLIENLVFQSSQLEWLSHRGADVPLWFQVVGTALLSALVWAGALPFASAVKAAAKIGERWDNSLQVMAEAEPTQRHRKQNHDDVGWKHFETVRRLQEGRNNISLAVAREDLPSVSAPSRPFWYCANGKDQPILIETAQEAAAALETLNILSWCADMPKATDDSLRGWLVSPLHPMARTCRWSFSNYLLATPGAVAMFLDHIATIPRAPVLEIEPQPKVALMNRLNAHPPRV